MLGLNENLFKIQTPKRFKRTLNFYYIDNAMQILREIPFFRPQNERQRAVSLVSDNLLIYSGQNEDTTNGRGLTNKLVAYRR